MSTSQEGQLFSFLLFEVVFTCPRVFENFHLFPPWYRTGVVRLQESMSGSRFSRKKVTPTGYIRKWKLQDDFLTLAEASFSSTHTTTSVFSDLAFIPHTARSYLLASADDHLTVFRFHDLTCAQEFEVKDPETKEPLFKHQIEQIDFVWPYDLEARPESSYFLLSGTHTVDEELVPEAASRIHLFEVVTQVGPTFEFFHLRSFESEFYAANRALMRITSNGRFLAAGSVDGEIVIWNLKVRPAPFAKPLPGWACSYCPRGR